MGVAIQGDLGALGDTLARCARLERLYHFGLVGSGSSVEFQRVYGGLLWNNRAILRHLVLSHRYNAFDLSCPQSQGAPVHFPNLEVLKIFNGKKVRAHDVEELLKVVGPNIRQLWIEATRASSSGVIVTPEMGSRIAAFAHLESFSLLAGPMDGRELFLKLSNHPTLRHLGICLLGAAAEGQLPPNLTSLDCIVDPEAVQQLFPRLKIEQLERFRFDATHLLEDADDLDELTNLSFSLRRCREVIAGLGDVADTAPEFFLPILTENPTLRRFCLPLKARDIGTDPKLHWDCEILDEFTQMLRILGISDSCVPLPPIFFSILSSMHRPSFDTTHPDSDSSDEDSARHPASWKAVKELVAGRLVMDDDSSKEETLRKFDYIGRHHRSRLVQRMMIRANLFELGKVLLRFGFPRDIRIVISKLAMKSLLL